MNSRLTDNRGVFLVIITLTLVLCVIQRASAVGCFVETTPMPMTHTSTSELTEAAYNKDTLKVKILISNNLDVNVKSNYGMTALMYEVTNKQTDIIKLLIEYGADVNAKSNSGKTALMIGAEVGSKEIVKLLLENGADVNLKTNDGNTPLSIAKRERARKEIIDLLKATGAKE